MALLCHYDSHVSTQNTRINPRLEQRGVTLGFRAAPIPVCRINELSPLWVRKVSKMSQGKILGVTSEEDVERLSDEYRIERHRPVSG